MARGRRDEDDPYAAYEDGKRLAGDSHGAGALAQWRTPLVGLLIGIGLGVALGLGTERLAGHVVGWAMMGFALGIAWMYVERQRNGR
jgi:hypothetical protein